jgi:hypothetical protein
MNHARSLRTEIVTLAFLCITAMQAHATGVADGASPPAQSEPAVAATEVSPDALSLGAVLRPEMFRPYVDAFNRNDRETVVNHISNAEAWDWLAQNVPLFECPDRDLDEIYYARFWFRGGGEPRKYSFWAADAIYARSLVLGDDRLPRELLPALIVNYQGWESSHLDASGLFWQNDGNDGMEVSIGGSGYRATINSYQYGDALAISRIAERDGQPDLARNWREKAAALKVLVNARLWDPQAQFYMVLPRGQTALANLLNHYSQDLITRTDYWKTFQCYLRSHRFRQLPPLPTDRPDPSPAPGGSESPGEEAQLPRIESRQPWIDENLNPFTGDWIARTLLRQRQQQPDERGKDYNHSTFCDLVITGVVGLRPRSDNSIELNPLLPEGTWDWFFLDRVRYHGRLLTVLWDRDGTRYGRGPGLQLFVDGQLIARGNKLERLVVDLPRD